MVSVFTFVTSGSELNHAEFPDNRIQAVSVGWQSLLCAIITLKVTRSVRAVTIRAALAGFPTVWSRARKSSNAKQHRKACKAAM